jgi:hypothetical protein
MRVYQTNFIGPIPPGDLRASHPPFNVMLQQMVSAIAAIAAEMAAQVMEECRCENCLMARARRMLVG